MCLKGQGLGFVPRPPSRLSSREPAERNKAPLTGCPQGGGGQPAFSIHWFQGTVLSGENPVGLGWKPVSRFFRSGATSSPQSSMLSLKGLGRSCVLFLLEKVENLGSGPIIYS